MTSSQESFLHHNTLASVALLCLNHVTTVELRNEAHVTGIVKDVDGFMNVMLEDVKFVDPKRNCLNFATFFVQNRLIRFIHIPRYIDISAQMRAMFEPKPREPRRKTTNELGISGGRQKILKIRQQRRNEDLANALKMKESMSGTQ